MVFTPPPYWVTFWNKGGGKNLASGAAGENFNVLDIKIIDFPLKIVFLDFKNLKIFACGALV